MSAVGAGARAAGPVHDAPLAARALTGDSVLSGTVVLKDGLLVPPGVTLLIQAGATLHVGEFSSQPSALKGLCVRGRLVCEGTLENPVRIVFGPPGGLIELKGQGRALLRHTAVSDRSRARGLVSVYDDAELDWRGGSVDGGYFGVVAAGGRTSLHGLSIVGSAQGVRVEGRGRVDADDLRLSGGGGDAFAIAGAGKARLSRCAFTGGKSGISAESGELELRDCRFSGQTGSAVASRGGRLRLTRLTIEDCAVGVAVTEGRVDAAVLSVAGCREGARVSGGFLALSESATSGGGAGLVQSGGELELRDCRFSGQSGSAVASRGGRQRLTRLKIEGCVTGLEVSGGRVDAASLSVAGCRRGASVAAGSLELSDASLRGGKIGLTQSGGRVFLRRIVLSDSETGLRSTGGAGKACVVRVSRCRRGLSAEGGELELEGFDAEGCTTAAVFSGDADCRWSGGSVEGGAVGVQCDGGRADLTRVLIAGARQGVRVESGRARLADSALSRNRDLGAVVCGPSAFLELERCRVSDSPGGLFVRAGHAHLLDGAAFRRCVRPFSRGPQGVVCARAAPESGAASAPTRRSPVLAFVLATKDRAAFRLLYRGLYSLGVFLFGLWARLQGGARAAWLHRGWVTGDWEPGVSDLDFVVLVEPASGGRPTPWLERFWRGYDAMRRVLPFLGEALVLTEPEWRGYRRWGGIRVSETAARRPLFGDVAADAPARPLEPAFKALGECAHAYTRLAQWTLAAPSSEWAVQRRQVYKAAVDLLRYGAICGRARPALPAPSRRLFWEEGLAGAELAPWKERLAPLLEENGGDARERDARMAGLAAAAAAWYHRRAEEFLKARPGSRRAAWSTRFARPVDEPGRRREFLNETERLRRDFDGALRGVVSDDLYRTYLVLEDSCVREEAAAGAFLNRLRLRRLQGRPRTLELPVSRSLWTLLTWLPYLDDPSRLLQIGGPEHARGAVFAAGRRPGSGRLYRWGLVEEPLFPPRELWKSAARESAANFRLSWRYLGSAHCGLSGAQTLHYLLSRPLGLKLMLEAGTAASFFDVDGLLAQARRHFPEAARALRAAPTLAAASGPAVFAALREAVEGCLPVLGDDDR